MHSVYWLTSVPSPRKLKQHIYDLHWWNKGKKNSRINCSGSDQRMPSSHSLDNGNYEVIKFDTPDIVFAEIDQSTINI